MHSFQSCFIFVCSGFLFVCLLFTQLSLIFMKCLLWLKSNGMMRQILVKRLLTALMLLWIYVIIAGISSSSSSSSLFAHEPKPPYWRRYFHASLNRWETWLAFLPLVGVSGAVFFKGMVIRKFLSSVRFWSHTAGICLGVAYPGGRSDDCIKKQIFPSENSRRLDQVFSLSHIPWVAKEYVKISFFWRKISVGMNLC